jgi:hypothetical protein
MPTEKDFVLMRRVIRVVFVLMIFILVMAMTKECRVKNRNEVKTEISK